MMARGSPCIWALHPRHEPVTISRIRHKGTEFPRHTGVFGRNMTVSDLFWPLNMHPSSRFLDKAPWRPPAKCHRDLRLFLGNAAAGRVRVAERRPPAWSLPADAALTCRARSTGPWQPTCSMRHACPVHARPYLAMLCMAPADEYYCWRAEVCGTCTGLAPRCPLVLGSKKQILADVDRSDKCLIASRASLGSWWVFR